MSMTKSLCDILITTSPFEPNGISHSYQFDQSISRFKGYGWYFSIFFFKLSVVDSVSKRCRSWSDTALCGVWSESALFHLRIQRGDSESGPPPPGKSQVIWGSIEISIWTPPPWKKEDSPPLENVGPTLDPWKSTVFSVIKP